MVGGNTQGVFSDVLGRQLPDEEYLTPSESTYDITGIPPDIQVSTLKPEQCADGTGPAFDADGGPRATPLGSTARHIQVR